MDVSILVKHTSEVQSENMDEKLLFCVTLDVSNAGRLVKLVHKENVLAKSLPLDTSIAGKLFKFSQLNHVPVKSITFEVSINGNEVRESQAAHV